MGKALVQVSLPMLRLILKLPNNVVLTRVRQTWEHEGRDFEILVESPDLPEVLEGQRFPKGVIVVHAIGCKEHGVDHIIGGEIKL